MDFLEIRRKAKERAAARAVEAAARAPAAPAAPSMSPPVEPMAPGPAFPGAGARWPAPSTAHPGALALEPMSLPDERGAAEDDRYAGFHPSRAMAGEDPASLEVAEAAARIEAQLAARLDELPAAPDARFRTWRPTGQVVSDVAPIAPEEAEEPQGAGRSAGWTGARSPQDPLDEFFYSQAESGAGLEGLPAAGAALDLPESAPALEEFLTFLLGEEKYGVAIGRVREVMRAPPVTEVPRAPIDVQGVITVRGEVVPVFDPRRRLGLVPGTPSGGGRVVIVEDGGGPCGLLVDAVANVVRLPIGAIEPCPQGMGGHSSDCLAGIGHDHDRLFTVLDVGALLRPARRAGEGRG